jgi:hypothetical protein
MLSLKTKEHFVAGVADTKEHLSLVSLIKKEHFVTGVADNKEHFVGGVADNNKHLNIVLPVTLLPRNILSLMSLIQENIWSPVR